MSHIAFLTIPASGHLNPTLPLVEELVRRGHRVSYATSAEYSPAIRRAGATPVELDWQAQQVNASQGGQTMLELLDMLMAGLNSSRAVLPTVRRWLTDDRPDLISYDVLTSIGPMTAAAMGLPAIATVPTFAGNDKFDLMRLLIPPDYDPTHPRAAEYVQARKQLAADFGVPDETTAGQGMFAKLNLVFIPREFQIHGEVFGPEYRFVGPSFGSRGEVGGWQPPTDGRPVLFVSLGTAVNDRPEFFARCAEAFGGSDWHVVMAVGTRVDQAELGEIPANFEIAPYFPQPEVLKHAKAFLSHCGMNSTMESLLCQVPLIAYPQTAEQNANAERAQELGLGRLADLDRLRETVDEVAGDQSIRDNLAEMAKHIEAAGGPKAGADAVEEVLA